VFTKSISLDFRRDLRLRIPIPENAKKVERMSDISLKQQQQAEADYDEFFKRFPSQKNPGDINTVDKFNFAVEIGWDRLRILQACRKKALPFTQQNN